MDEKRDELREHRSVGQRYTTVILVLNMPLNIY